MMISEWLEVDTDRRMYHSESRILHYTIGEVAPYINWIYFFHAWGIEPRFATVTELHQCPACRAGWIGSFAKEEQAKAREAATLYTEALQQLRAWGDAPVCKALFLIDDANSEGDDIVIGGHTRIPLLRQQQAGKEGYTLCLSDFIRPATSGTKDRIGVFATTVHLSHGDNSLLASTLADRLAEATAEKMHEEVRKRYWGYAPDEQLSMRELHEERFQGIRPAVGYPSLPDQSINHLIDKLLGLADIGVRVSENGAMMPHCSVSGFLFAHPKARYFSVGNISDEQLTDYAHRRGLTPATIKKFLHRNVGSLD